jgi:hypothetical protein
MFNWGSPGIYEGGREQRSDGPVGGDRRAQVTDGSRDGTSDAWPHDELCAPVWAAAQQWAKGMRSYGTGCWAGPWVRPPLPHAWTLAGTSRGCRRPGSHRVDRVQCGVF